MTTADGRVQPAGAGTTAAVHRYGRRIVVVGLAVALLGVLAAAGLVGTRWYAADQRDRLRAEMIAAACRIVADFVGIGAATVDADLHRVADAATGDFRTEFVRGMPQLRAAVVDSQVRAEATVLAAGVVTDGDRAARVLVAVDALVHNVRAPAGRHSQYRVEIDLAREPGHDRWLAAGLRFIP